MSVDSVNNMAENRCMMTRPSDEVASLRAFNRIYTNRLGLLEAHLDGSRFTLSEARVLYEIATRRETTAAAIGRELNMDRAQISRTLKRFADRNLIDARDDPGHGRQQLLALTAEGEAAFADLNARTDHAVGSFLESFTVTARHRLLSAALAMTHALSLNGRGSEVQLRGLRTGDLGMVTARQAMIYADEFGWDQGYEALVARILADFHDQFDLERDAGWIAEIDETMAGSIFLVRGDHPGQAKLRLLYVEPFARRAGVGAMLVAACVDQARALGYEHLVLWTNSVLVSARRLYERFGFTLIEEAPHRSFGQDLVGQTWSLAL